MVKSVVFVFALLAAFGRFLSTEATGIPSLHTNQDFVAIGNVEKKSVAKEIMNRQLRRSRTRDVKKPTGR